MSPRTGRPKKENPKNVNLNLRLTKDEAQMIQDCADALETSRTAVILNGVRRIKDELDKNP